jgi:hypothetical protein
MAANQVNIFCHTLQAIKELQALYDTKQQSVPGSNLESIHANLYSGDKITSL